MTQSFSIYCDESCHMQSATDSRYMVLGALRCSDDVRSEALTRIRQIKNENGKQFSELKWNRVSTKTLPLYKDVINFFFDKDNLVFRAIIIDKNKLDHEAHNQTHDQFYYKIYFRLLERMVDPKHQYRIFLDIKDTQGHSKVTKLKEVICTSVYDRSGEMIKHIQEARSHEVTLMQVVDILIGAVQYANRFNGEGQSPAKNELVEHIRLRSKLSLQKTTFAGAEKFNLLMWEPKPHV